MIISQHINDLLFQHECVIIPQFGAFVSQEKTATIDTNKLLAFPPRRILTFNRLIKNNDGLLINHITSKTGRSYDEIKQEVTLLVQQWNTLLEQGDKLSIEGVGIIYKNNNQFLFEPISSANFAKKAFGLQAVTAKPVQQKQIVSQTNQTVTANTIETNQPLDNSENKTKPYLKYAAIFVGFGLLALGANSYNISRQNKIQQQLVAKQQIALEKKIQTATIFVTDENIPEVTLNIKTPVKEEISKPIDAKYSIIIGAFRNIANAEKRIATLKEKGLDAYITSANKYGLHQVAAYSTNDEKTAINTLHKFQKTVSKAAWLYIKAN